MEKGKKRSMIMVFTVVVLLVLGGGVGVSFCTEDSSWEKEDKSAEMVGDEANDLICEKSFDEILKEIELTAGDVNICDFAMYVKEDGDWSVAFSNAETVAKELGKPLFIPAGEYKFTNYFVKKDAVDWYGEGEQSVLYFGDDFNSATDVVGDSNYIIVTEHQEEGARDTFILSNLCFEHRLTTDASFNISGFFLVTYTEDVVLNRLFIKYNSGESAKKTRIFDFKAANSNSTIQDCFIYGSNGGIGFRNFAESPCTNVVIKDNTIIRTPGSVDEGIWVCANVGPIQGVTITGNTIRCIENADLSSGIYVVQADSYTSKRNNVVSDVVIENNHIEANNIMYYAIDVGTYLNGFPNVENVRIANNTILGYGMVDYKSSGICCQNAVQTEIVDNEIVGAFTTFISGGETVSRNKVIEKDNESQIETTGIAYAKRVDYNEVSVSKIGFKDCDILDNNTITSATNYIHTAKGITITNNTFQVNGDWGKCVIGAYITGKQSGYTKPYLQVENNIFYCEGKKVFHGDVELSMKNNTAENTPMYHNGYAESYTEAVNNSYTTPEGQQYNDSEMKVRIMSEYPETLRRAVPKGYRVYSSNGRGYYKKISSGASTFAWIYVPSWSR